MKRPTQTSLLFSAVMIFFLASCGDGGSDKKAGNDSIPDSSNTTATPVKPEAGTIVTTPQAMMIATHKVANFGKWITSYDEHDSLRLANGLHSYVIGRGLQDSNMVLVAVKVDDMVKAKAFAKDPGLKKAMQKGGVAGTPSFSFVTMTFQDTAVINTPLRSRTTFRVKNWEAWQKSFEEGKQERMDNGIAVRAFGHDEGDEKKVVLVTAITDTARAFAYYKSDILKKRREAGGVITEPVRFLFRVVKRY